MTMIRIVAGAAGVLIAATAFAAARPVSMPMLTAGSPDLDLAHFHDTSFVQQIFTRSRGDTIETARARLASWERSVGGEVVTGFTYDPPFSSIDTCWVRRSDMAPVHESLRYQGQLIQLQYDGKRVTRTAQHGDSTPTTVHQEFPVAPFAFNQLDPLVRSIPYRRITRDPSPLLRSRCRCGVRHRHRASGRPVRTGPPPMSGSPIRRSSQLYTIDRSTRAIVGHASRHAASGSRFRYAPVM